MFKSILTAVAIAAAAMICMPDPADAQRGGGGGFRGGGGGGGAFRGGGGGGFRGGGGPAFRGGGGFRGPSVRPFRPGPRPGFRHRGRTVIIAPVYGGGCEWLRRRALSTGSPYWWSRYNACRF